MRAPLFIATIAVALVDTSGVLAAEPPCTSHDNMLAALAERYKEAPVAVGLEDRGALTELLTTADGSTWSLIVTGPNGRSCLVASGQDWEARERAPEGPQL